MFTFLKYMQFSFPEFIFVFIVLAIKMLRYTIIRKLYPLLSLIAQLYYAFVNAVFMALNTIKPKQKVEWTSEELENELLFLSAKEAAEKIRQKQIKSSQLVDSYIARIQRVQPLVNAMVADNFDAAKAEAKAVDEYIAELDEDSEEFQNLPTNKPLLGVPFTFKNNMDMKGFVTVSGFGKFLKNAPAKEDSKVMTRLRQSGAIPIALTNLPKMATNWVTENETFGRTSNPYDLRRIPGGSSGGESALVASGASIFGIGNDLGGSVRIPAFMCGLFGLKPTKDVIPLDGFVPKLEFEVARAQWSIGPLCRYAEDLPLVFSTLSGKSLSEVNVACDLAKSRLKELKIFYLDQLNIWFVEKPHPEVCQALKTVVEHFEQTFNLTSQKVNFPLAHHFYELWGSHGFGEPAKKPIELIAELPKFIKGQSDMTCCAWCLAFLHAFVETRNDGERDFMVEKLGKLRTQLANAMGDHGLLLLPPWPTLAPFHRQGVFTPFNLPYTQLFNLLGFPALVCPVGLDPKSGMPLGVQLVGPPHSEPLLMTIAMELQRAFGGWIRP